MQPEFFVLCFSSQELPVKLFWVYRLFPAEAKKKLEEKHRWKKFPCKEEIIQICDRQGQKIILPYTKKQWKHLDKDKVSEKLKHFMEKEAISRAAAEDDFAEYLTEDKIINGKQIQKILLKQWIDFLIQKHHIKKKEMRLLIIDEGEEDISYVLNTIYDDVNYMTICTERKEYFEHLSEELYLQTGLMLEVIPMDTRSEMQADIVIDFKEDKKIYRLYPKQSVVIDMAASAEKTEYIRVKRSDIRYYHRLFVKQDNVIYADNVVEAAVMGGLHSFTEEEYNYYKVELENQGLLVCDGR